MQLKDKIEELSRTRLSRSVEDTCYKTRLHEILAQSWQFALQKDCDLSGLHDEDISPNPLCSTADLHHFESEYGGLDE